MRDFIGEISPLGGERESMQKYFAASIFLPFFFCHSAGVDPAVRRKVERQGVPIRASKQSAASLFPGLAVHSGLPGVPNGDVRRA